MQKVKIKDWSGQSLYIGLDLHKQKWVVTVRTQELELKTFTIPSDKMVLLNTLQRNWKGAHMSAVYEAGCFGYHLIFWIKIVSQLKLFHPTQYRLSPVILSKLTGFIDG